MTDWNAVERARWGGPSPAAGKGHRRLTAEERIEARHLLQVLSEAARPVRNAMDPVSGMPVVTVSAWAAQWATLRDDLDSFTYRVTEAKPAAGGVPDRNE